MKKLFEINTGVYPARYFPVTLPISSVKTTVFKNTFLFVGAHPDDIEIGCAATISKFLRQGFTIYYLICTSGKLAKGVRSETRILESQTAALKLGIAGVFYLDLRDTELEYQKDLTRRLEEIILFVNPAVLFTHSKNDDHQDHIAVASKSRVAAYKHVPNIYFYPSYRSINEFNPSLFCPMTEAEIDKKEQLLSSCFPSQVNDRLLKKLRFFAGSHFCESFKRVNSDFSYVEAFEVLRQLINSRFLSSPFHLYPIEFNPIAAEAQT